MCPHDDHLTNKEHKLNNLEKLLTSTPKQGGELFDLKKNCNIFINNHIFVLIVKS